MPRTGALPGLHLDARLNGHATDIYLAPLDYFANFEMAFSKGDEVKVTGSLTRMDGIDYVLVREISVGRMTLYLRTDDGTPVWNIETEPTL